jgi:hypothetical protein
LVHILQLLLRRKLVVVLRFHPEGAELMNAVSDASDESILTMSKEDLMALLE